MFAALARATPSPSSAMGSKGQQKGGGNREKQAPAPLSQVQLQSVRQCLQENGGSMDLGKLSRAIGSVKKAQLESHFSMSQTENGSWMVSSGKLLHGGKATPSPLTKGGGKSAAAKAATPAKAAKAASAPTPSKNKTAAPAEAFVKLDASVPLSEAQTQSIAQLLEQNGGSLDLGKVARAHPGLKKKHLEGLFHVRATDAAGQNVVVELATAGKPVLQRHEGVSAAGKASIKRKFGDTGGQEDLAPIDEAQADCMREFVYEGGGSMDLGVFTRQFQGVKKSQLVGHLEVHSADGKVVVALPSYWKPNSVQIQQKRQKDAQAEIDKAAKTEGRKEEKRQRLEAKQAGGAPALPAIDEDVVAQMQGLLIDNGGAMDLGKLMQNFHGFKKAQLAQRFELVQAKDKENKIFVLAEGHSSVPAGLDMALPDGRKKSSPYGAGDCFVPLMEDQIQAIRTLIRQNGGSFDLGKIARSVPGVKRQQVEAHFTITGVKGQVMVSAK